MACFHLPSVQCDECRGLRNQFDVPVDISPMVRLENEMAHEQLRAVAQILIAEVGASGPMNVEEAAIKAARVIKHLRAVLQDIAEGDCTYGDDCPFPSIFAQRHGQCIPCKARKALSVEYP
jgi:hypothetical protein